MPYSLTYTSLVDSLKAYAERTGDTTMNAYIPQFIYMAEMRVAQEVKVLPAINFVTANFQSGTAVYEKPGRLRDFEFFSFTAGAAGFESTPPFTRKINILKRTYDFCVDFWPDRSVTGVPQFYCDYGMANMLVVPTPNAAYPFEIGYNELAQPLSDSNQTNWMTQYAPNMLLYASLWEMQKFLKNFDMADQWEKQYTRAALALRNEDVLQTTDAQSSSSSEGG